MSVTPHSLCYCSTIAARLGGNRNHERCAGHYDGLASGQGPDALGVQILTRVEMVLDEFKPLSRRSHGHAVRKIGSARTLSPDPAAK